MSAGSVAMITTQGEAATLKLARTLASRCQVGDCVTLEGDLGTGKTTFARGFIQALNPALKEITSPTFTLVQQYEADRGHVWHYDLYRLRHAEELEEIALDEALISGITLIEWPELAAARLPQQTLAVSISSGSEEDTRRWRFTSPSGRWQACLAELKQEFTS